MAEKDNKQFLTVDDLHLLMQGYKNTVELSQSVLKQQEEIIKTSKEINEKLDENSDAMYDLHEKTDEKIEKVYEKISGKIETQNKEDILTKEDISKKIGKVNYTVWLGILGLVSVIGTLITMLLTDHKSVLHLLKLIAHHLSITIQ